jgi:hypothetical protein
MDPLVATDNPSIVSFYGFITSIVVCQIKNPKLMLLFFTEPEQPQRGFLWGWMKTIPLGIYCAD